MLPSTEKPYLTVQFAELKGIHSPVVSLPSRYSNGKDERLSIRTLKRPFKS